MSAWSILGLIAKFGESFIPGRAERLRNKIDKIKKEKDEIAKKKGRLTVVDARRYMDLTNKLSEIESKLQNR